MADGIDISILTGKAKEIAIDIDTKYVKDNRLAGGELSIFLADCERNGVKIENESWYSKCKDEIEKYLQGIKKAISIHDTAAQDAVKDAKQGVKPIDSIPVSGKDVKVANLDLQVKEQLLKREICEKMYKKWSAKFKAPSINQAFFEKLYDTLDVLKVEISEKDWDKKNYSSPKEEAFDKVIAILVGESKLNPRLIGYVKKRATFYGLFQLSSDGLKTAKRWAAKHPEVQGMSNIDPSITIETFKTLSGAEQLDYLVAYIGASRDASKIKKDEKLSPAKLWSMIKLPNLDENIPEKRARRNRTVVQKADSIKRIFTANKIPFGIK